MLLRARLIEEMYLAVRPMMPGAGENLRSGIDMRTLGYETAKSVAGARATHVFIRKGANG